MSSSTRPPNDARDPSLAGPDTAGSASPRRRWLAVARALVALLSLSILVGSGVAWASYRDLTSSVGHGASLNSSGADPDGKDQNILLLGNDSRAGATPAELKALGTEDDGGTVNTDTMMLMHIPAAGGKASVISFPRDSWVQIPGYGKGKLNAAYPDGYNAAQSAGKNESDSESAGVQLLADTLTELTGLKIDHFVEVNLLGFYRISNAIGGVQVNLCAAQNPETDSDAYGKGYSGINLPAGVSNISGTQALAFVRQRHGLPHGDLDRIKRQQYFLSAAFSKVASAGTLLNPFKLKELMDAVGTSITTDSGLNLVSLAQRFQEMSAGNITFLSLPNKGAQTITVNGSPVSIVAVDYDAIPAFVNTLEGKAADPALDSATASAPGEVTVDVLNGTATAGLAGRNGDRLKELGFNLNTVDSTDSTAQTTIEYADGMQSQAKALQQQVNGAKMELTTAVSHVTLVLGSNGVQVNGLASATPAPTGTTAAPSTNTAPTNQGCIN